MSLRFQGLGVSPGVAVGNVYLHGGGFHVLIRGNPPPAVKQRRTRITRPAGAQILFVLRSLWFRREA